MTVTEKVWLTHADALEHCNLKAGSRVLYRAAADTNPRYRLQSARIRGTGPLRFKREWLDSWLERMSSPVTSDNHAA